MLKQEWKEIALYVLHNWFLIRKSMYFILIKDIFFCNKKQEIMIKYQCSNKRIGDIIPITEFMQSPLKHATHPDQLMQIGMELERQLNNLHTNSNRTNKIQLNRFKQVFYNSCEEA